MFLIVVIFKIFERRKLIRMTLRRDVMGRAYKCLYEKKRARRSSDLKSFSKHGPEGADN